VRVRARTGWPIVGGFILCERTCAPPKAVSAARFEGVEHYWNVTPRGLWVDATPRPAGLPAWPLVESALTEVPLPEYAARAHEPQLIVASEGLCNRLRAVLSYRQVAHDAGRPLLVVWRKDEFCPAHFDDLFLSIPGVRFVKLPPAGRSLHTLCVASDTHPAIKHSPSEAYSWAVLAPNDALRHVIAQQVDASGPRYAAVHVRRTDLHTALPKELHTKDGDFERFVDACRGGGGGGVTGGDVCNVFIAADNAHSQATLASYCGERARIHRPIRPSSALRQTTLLDAVVDLYVCAAATDGFCGSHGSSFSDAIRSLRILNGRCDSWAEHRPDTKAPPPVSPVSTEPHGTSPSAQPATPDSARAAPAAGGASMRERLEARAAPSASPAQQQQQGQQSDNEPERLPFGRREVPSPPSKSGDLGLKAAIVDVLAID